MNPWIWLSSFGCVLFAFLWRFGLPKYRATTGAWAIACALFCAAILLGPPLDIVAGAAAMVGIAVGLLYLKLTGEL